MFGTGSMSCCRLPIGGDACYQLGQGPERGPNAEYHARMAEGTEADRSENAPGATCLQQETGFTEPREFHDLPGSLVPVLNT